MADPRLVCARRGARVLELDARLHAGIVRAGSRVRMQKRVAQQRPRPL